MTKQNGLRRLQILLSGDPDSFTLENRAFNYTAFISLILLAYYVAVDLVLSQYNMAWIVAVVTIVLGALYYYARVKRRYKTGILIYAVISYCALVLNYFVNSGIDGPTICLFFLSFFLLVTIGSRRHYPLWITLHLLVLISLLALEFLRPDLVPNLYKVRDERFFEMGATCAAVIFVMFTMITFLRTNLEAQRLHAEQKEHDIAGQNKQIVEQNHQLERVNEEKTKLFSIIAHDLRAPLDSIRGYLELASEHLLTEDEMASMHRDLLTQTKYTSDLLQNLLYWSKAQMKGITVQLVPISVRELVDDVCGNKLRNAATKGIKITYSINAVIEVMGDKDMLRIVLRNLVNNAIKFTRPGGEIVIKAEPNGDNAVLSVRDNGIGIPPERRQEMFKLKTSSTYGTANEKGIGLGLILCKEFTEYQGGKLWFTSEVGTGSTFFVQLPLTKMSVAALYPQR